MSRLIAIASVLAACGEAHAPAAILPAGAGSAGDPTGAGAATAGGAGSGGASGMGGGSGTSNGNTGSDAAAVGRPRAGVLFYANYGKEDETRVIDDPWLTGALFQIYWSDVETVRDQPDWRALDARIAHWTDAGKYVALRVMWSSSGYWPDPKAKTPTPQWVWQLGARYAEHALSQTEIPLFWDPIYQERALVFLAELASHYDSNPRVLFIDVTPGAETNPYRFGTIDQEDPGFRDVFTTTKASDGTTYTYERWGTTVTSFTTKAKERFSHLPLLVTLNAGAMPGEPPRMQQVGDLTVSLGMMVGQNGLRGVSYPTMDLQQRWLTWGGSVPLFFEMATATGVDAGTMQQVVDAAARVKASFLNVYASDVLRGTVGSATYDAAYEKALQNAATSLGATP